jgi:2-hydroxy-6-oxonona-2,4-dienedioate hydrolase
VFAAEDDVHFPGPASIARAREVFPNVVEAEILAGCKHSPPFDDAFRRGLCSKIAAFLG